MRTEPHFVSSFGLAFAGDTLPALMTYATLTTCAANLTANGHTDPPSVRDIAELAQRIGTEIGREAAEGHNNTCCLEFEAAVFGWCPQLRRFAVYKLKSGKELDTRLALQIEETLPKGPADLVTLGTGGPRVVKQVEISAATSQTRAPLWAMKSMVSADDRTSDVGGGLSIACCSANPAFGVELYGWARPVPGHLSPAFTYNGLDTERVFGSIGRHFVNIKLMA